MARRAVRTLTFEGIELAMFGPNVKGRATDAAVRAFKLMAVQKINLPDAEPGRIVFMPQELRDPVVQESGRLAGIRPWHRQP